MSLREQMLKAGLATKKQAKKAANAAKVASQRTDLLALIRSGGAPTAEAAE